MTDPWERFWPKVAEATDESPNGWTGCWLWTARRLPNGYGQFWLAGAKRYAHRVAYEMVIGAIPRGLEIDHLCRRPSCVNPAHLEPVTHAENGRRSIVATRPTCLHGHPRTEASWDRRWRRCRICHAERERRRYAAR